MNINQKIEETLGGITKNIWPMCCPLQKPPEKYIVYNPEIEEPGYHADDLDCEWVQHMQIHLFTKKNYVNDRKAIKNLLKKAEFVMTGIETFYEKDTGYYHLCFECYTEEEDT